MNSITVTGRFGADPELNRVGDDDTAVVNGSIAENNGRQTNWFNVVFWGRTAETVAEHFSVGDGIEVTGRMERDDWEDDEGNSRTNWKIRVNSFGFPPSNRDSASNDRSGGGSDAQDDFPALEEEDEVPF
jgi:single-strand DNA-binding protein